MEYTYMQRALELAELGRGKVSPNPMVGCVIVRDNRIIGEGWHREYGGPHAEVMAIGDVKDETLLRGSDVYVNLEPCSHYGKTPPCADLLISHEVRQVFIANLDINPLVRGKGIERLRQAGIRVREDLLPEEGYQLNRRFFRFHEKNRPFILLKWAQTADGLMARENHDARWISNEYARQMVHKWRSEEDAIMVGARTVIHDNPRLNVRDWNGKNPVRVIMDPHLETGESSHIYDHTVKTLIYNLRKDQQKDQTLLIRVGESSFLQDVFQDMKNKGIQSVLVEGGATLLTHLFDAGLWDEARVFISPKTFGRGLRAPQILGANLVERVRVFDDDLYIFNNEEYV